ncbi:MAG: ASCH domain-containing protein [Anaerolineae bacterium]|nr:ASCH domain-containing protein [Anaerolineae bacterium]
MKTENTMNHHPSPRVKVLWVRPEYLDEILSGRKTIEVRVGYSNIRRLRPGDILRLNDVHPYRIRRITTYPDFETLLAHEPAAAIAPDMDAAALLQVLRTIYPPDKEALGAVAIEVEAVPEAYSKRRET